MFGAHSRTLLHTGCHSCAFAHICAQFPRFAHRFAPQFCAPNSVRLSALRPSPARTTNKPADKHRLVRARLLFDWPRTARSAFFAGIAIPAILAKKRLMRPQLSEIFQSPVATRFELEKRTRQQAPTSGSGPRDGNSGAWPEGELCPSLRRCCSGLEWARGARPQARKWPQTEADEAQSHWS